MFETLQSAPGQFRIWAMMLVLKISAISAFYIHIHAIKISPREVSKALGPNMASPIDDEIELQQQQINDRYFMKSKGCINNQSLGK